MGYFVSDEALAEWFMDAFEENLAASLAHRSSWVPGSTNTFWHMSGVVVVSVDESGLWRGP